MENNMIFYAVCMLLSAALCAALYTRRMHRRYSVGAAFCAVTLLMMIVLGTAGARLFYVVTQITRVVSRGFMKQLLSDDISLFSFTGGLLGVSMAVWISAKLFKADGMKALDLFAPVGALLAALVRLCEGFLVSEEIGLGSEMVLEKLCFFPLAVMNDWEEYYGAVFLLEALCCAAAALLSQIRFRGDAFLRTLFALCLPQIICQSLLKDNLLWWFFLKVEQLYCVLVCMGFVFYFTAKKHAGAVPPVLTVLCVGVIAFCEYALDKLTVIPSPVTYGIMLLAVAFIGFAAVKAYRADVKDLAVTI